MDKPVHDAAPIKSKTEARQGETSGHMRWVLAASIILIVVVFAGIWLFTR
jgi:hypothetical protein